MTTAHSVTTVEQLWAASSRLGRCELVRGELITMSPSRFRHGVIAGRIAARMSDFVNSHGLGAVATGDPGFVIQRNPDTVLAPDVAFVREDRLDLEPDAGFFAGAPDLAVEVNSPRDRVRDIRAKVSDWLQHGCQMVWVVDPKAGTIAIYQDDHADPQIFQTGQEICLTAVLPGFVLRINDIFA